MESKPENKIEGKSLHADPVISESDLPYLEKLACTGDSQAFSRLIKLVDGDLRGVAWNIVRDSSALDDIMQDTYIKAFKSVKNFNQNSSMKTWLYTICYRTALDYIKSEDKHSHVELDTDVLDSSKSVDNSVIDSLSLKKVLDILEPDSRSLLYLVSCLGYSYDEVAQISGFSRGTVASKVSRAKEMIRRVEDE